ncbi:hypothetical protein [Ensifer sp. YR511]|uniref:DUF7007 domain-containing protein n=1 Tax=Ensifer sp. YR511 TaxID=1855294 RepID=UPI00115FAE82|nr:hypothetical protein [Ensifer sp. YR511]
MASSSIATASHGGSALTTERKQTFPSRRTQRCYADCACAAVAVSFPDLFTDFEKRHADETLRLSLRWEVMHPKTLGAGQSRAKDRRRFEQENAKRWVFASEIFSTQCPGPVNCAARPGRRHDGEQRRYLAAEEFYSIGDFVFVIDEARDDRYPNHRASSAPSSEAPPKPPLVGRLNTR